MEVEYAVKLSKSFGIVILKQGGGKDETPRDLVLKVCDGWDGAVLDDFFGLVCAWYGPAAGLGNPEQLTKEGGAAVPTSTAGVGAAATAVAGAVVSSTAGPTKPLMYLTAQGVAELLSEGGTCIHPTTLLLEVCFVGKDDTVSVERHTFAASPPAGGSDDGGGNVGGADGAAGVNCADRAPNYISETTPTPNPTTGGGGGDGDAHEAVAVEEVAAAAARTVTSGTRSRKSRGNKSRGLKFCNWLVTTFGLEYLKQGGERCSFSLELHSKMMPASSHARLKLLQCTCSNGCSLSYHYHH
jgi:hypothetical protein